MNFVKSPNGFEPSVNRSVGPPTIDEKVTAGTLARGECKAVSSGWTCPYPFRLNYFKFDDPNASIELSWKTPVGDKEIIPAEYFFTRSLLHPLLASKNFHPMMPLMVMKRGSKSIPPGMKLPPLLPLKHQPMRGNEWTVWPEPMKRTKTGRQKKIITFSEEFLRHAFREKLTTEELHQYVHSKFSAHTPCIPPWKNRSYCLEISAFSLPRMAGTCQKE